MLFLCHVVSAVPQTEMQQVTEKSGELRQQCSTHQEVSMETHYNYQQSRTACLSIIPLKIIKITIDPLFYIDFTNRPQSLMIAGLYGLELLLKSIKKF